MKYTSGLCDRRDVILSYHRSFLQKKSYNLIQKYNRERMRLSYISSRDGLFNIFILAKRYKCSKKQSQ